MHDYLTTQLQQPSPSSYLTARLRQHFLEEFRCCRPVLLQIQLAEHLQRALSRPVIQETAHKLIRHVGRLCFSVRFFGQLPNAPALVAAGAEVTGLRARENLLATEFGFLESGLTVHVRNGYRTPEHLQSSEIWLTWNLFCLSNAMLRLFMVFNVFSSSGPSRRS